MKYTIYAFFLLFHVVSATMVSRLEPFPASIDELAHYSYVRHAAVVKTMFINHEESFLLNESDLKRWSDTNNYLSHPSLYYRFMSMAYSISGEDPKQEIARLRAANIFMSSAAIAILFTVGFRTFRSSVSHIVFAAAASMLPKIAVVGGIINNDNLALFGAACSFLGLSWLMEKRDSAGIALLTGTGFALAALAKLTAGLQVGLMIVFVHAGMYRKFLPVSRKHTYYIAILLALAIVGISPYLLNLVTMGKPIYINDSSYAALYLGHHSNLDSWGFVGHFFSRLVVKWAAYEPSNFYQILSFFCLLILAAMGLARTFFDKGANHHLGIILKSAFAAILIMLFTHIYYLHAMYEKTGHLGGATIRYYIPIWPAVAMAAASGIELITNERARSYLLMLLLILLISSTAPFAILWHHFID